MLKIQHLELAANTYNFTALQVISIALKWKPLFKPCKLLTYLLSNDIIYPMISRWHQINSWWLRYEPWVFPGWQIATGLTQMAVGWDGSRWPKNGYLVEPEWLLAYCEVNPELHCMTRQRWYLIDPDCYWIAEINYV